MNLDILSSMGGQTIEVGVLADLNKALRANGNNLAKATVGGAPGAGNLREAGFSGDFAPLVPQSIQNTLDSASFTEKHIVFWNKLSKVPVTSTLHEATVVNDYGSMALDPFIAEGGIGPNSDSTYERKVVEIKYMAEQREISDVATMVSAIGYNGMVNRQGLAIQTMDGTRALLGKLERSLFSADSALNSLAFDGLFKQLASPSYDISSTAGNGLGLFSTSATANYTDLAGAAVTVQDLISKLYEAAAAPNFALIDTILVEPRVYSGLVNQATSYGRFDTNSAAGGSLVFGTDGLKIAGPAGMVDIVSCPLLLEQQAIPTNAAGSTGKPLFAAPANAIAAGKVTQIAIATVGSSKGFTATTAGTYTYKCVAVNSSGYSGVATSAAETVSAGEVNQIELDMSSTSAAPADYVKVWRKKSTESDYAYLGAWPAHTKTGYDATAAAAHTTYIIDDDSRQANVAPVYFLQTTPDVLYWAQLLDFLRRPIAQTKTTVPFLMMLFGSLHVKVPTKSWTLGNAAFNAL